MLEFWSSVLGPSYKQLKTDFILLLTTENGVSAKLLMNLLFHQAAILFLQFFSFL